MASNTRVLFVPYQPGRSSSSGDGEISQQKHAAREYHRKAKQRRQSAKHDADPDKVVGKKPDTSHQPILPRSRSSQSMTCPLVKLMGAGRVDPFNSYGIGDLSPHAHKMLDYSLVYQWPLFAFSNPGATIDDMKRHVMGRMMYSTTSMYAVIFAGATHYALLHGSRDMPEENAMLRLNYKTRALRQISHEIETMGSNIPNKTLYTMLGLAAYGKSVEKLHTLPYKKNPSVLAKAHDLEFYSTLPVEWAHLQALFHLLKERGGLPSIARPGFALVISLYDVLTSVQRLAKPEFPLLHSTDSVLDAWPAILDDSSLLVQTLGSSFKRLSSTASFRQLNKTLDHVVGITLSYERYQRSSPDAPVLHHILKARSTVLHDLLSLPDLSSNALRKDDTIYELCRLGAFSFMLATLYPLSRENGPHDELARRMMIELENASTLNLWAAHSTLLLWATILGGITAKKTEFRPWYVNYLTGSGVTFSAWQPLSSTLTSYLWLSSECDPEGLSMWEEAWNV